MRRGFTLFEILLALGLLTIMTGLIVPTYLRTGRIQTVRAATEKIKQAYIQARDGALSGKKDTGVCGANPLQGWMVQVTSGTPYTLLVQGVCSTNDYPGAYTAFFTRSENLPTGITVNFSTGLPNGILFRPGGQGIYPPLSGGSTITVTIADASGNSGVFTINSYGGIQ